MNDHKGNAIELGATVICIGYGYGCIKEHMHLRGEVTGFGRTRVKVRFYGSDVRNLRPVDLRVVS